MTLSPASRNGAASVPAEAAHVALESDVDIVAARRIAREIAERTGFTGGDLALITTAISEITRNILSYAGRGKVTLTTVADKGRRGITVVASDQGPGIADVERAMCDGFSTSKGLGLGLPGARRLMDDFKIVSTVGKGTTVTMTKWLR